MGTVNFIALMLIVRLSQIFCYLNELPSTVFQNTIFLKISSPYSKKKWANGSDFANSEIITTKEIYDDNEITNQIKHLSYQPKVSSTDPKVSFLRFENAYMFYAPDQECFLYRLNAENKKENSKFYDHLGLYFDALNKRSHPFKERKIASRPSINMDYLDAEHSR